ncbi:Integral membrane sensor signal transduction histidine kinase [uncultured Desulfatiglans sp.]|uniref:histidine kinase n=1 Tax=Uncultured Desulfatiglans sp. TaxID=1748965 RepID=A0A653A4F6_UNCDX|nr:Integral membrane sensor signal transduction histidine kinase [uncultured Desulfatiglans sp.]
MGHRHKNKKLGILIFLVVCVLFLHYCTIHDVVLRHAIYRMLFFLPLVLGSFWFGLKGAIFVSISIIIPYIPYVYHQWNGFYQEFDKFLEAGLFVFMGCLLGYLSEKQQREQEARLKAERLAAIGSAVSQIAHDLKSPLMAIGGFTKQVTRHLSIDHPDRKKLDLVISETFRMEAMVKEMLDFGRPFQLQKTEENLNHLAAECIEISLPFAKSSGVDINTEFDPEITVRPLDSNRMKQVILNLLTNAIQASSSGKIVSVRTKREKQGVALDISDCGCGIKAEDQQKIFEPFFSSKKEGTGLGLAIVKKIVELHGGHIILFSNPEGGVTFSIKLP